MLKTIKISDKDYPVNFGWNTSSLICELLGVSLDELSFVNEKNITPRHVIVICYAGLKDGARIEKKEFKLSLEDIGDLLDKDLTLFGQILKTYSEANGQGQNENKKEGENSKN